MSTITIAISTLNDGFNRIDIEKIKTICDRHNFSLLIIHQISNDFNYDYSKVELIDFCDVIVTKDKGLSKSRNIALNSCKTEFLLLSDDDVDYLGNSLDVIVKGDYLQGKYVSCFKACIKSDHSKDFKAYSKSSKKLNTLDCAKVSSIEMIVNMKLWRKSPVYFDEQFGLGTSNPSGEEFIFLTDIKKQGEAVFFQPSTIVAHDEFSSGQDFYSSDELCRAKVNMFNRVYSSKSFFYIFAFFIKKFKVLLRNRACFRFLSQWYKSLL